MKVFQLQAGTCVALFGTVATMVLAIDVPEYCPSSWCFGHQPLFPMPSHPGPLGAEASSKTGAHEHEHCGLRLIATSIPPE